MKKDTKLAYDRRVEPRHDVRREIQYTLLSESDKTTYKGVTVNVSISGVCLYVHFPLDAGQRIKIATGVRGRPRESRVCWFRKIDEGVYKAGLKLC